MEEAHKKLDRLEIKIKSTREKAEQSRSRAERYRTIILNLESESEYYAYKMQHLAHKFEMLKSSLDR